MDNPPANEDLQIQRLFYTERDISPVYDEWKVVAEPEQIARISKMVNVSSTVTHIFGVFGDDQDKVVEFVRSCFPSEGTETIEQIMIPVFADDINKQPCIWALSGSTMLVLVLATSQEPQSKDNLLTIMQKSLQDLCEHIVLCPTQYFFTNFCPEHPFKGKPHAGRTYMLVETKRTDCVHQKVQFDTEGVVNMIPAGAKPIATSTLPCSYYAFKQPYRSLDKAVFDKLTESLLIAFTEITSNLSVITLTHIRSICEKSNVLLERQLDPSITEIIDKYNSNVTDLYTQVDNIVRSLFRATSFWDPLIGLFSSENNQKQQIRDYLRQQVAQWLVNTKSLGMRVETLLDNLIGDVRTNYLTGKKAEKVFDKMITKTDFIAELSRHDCRKQVAKLQKDAVDEIIQHISTSKIEVKFNIYRVDYNPIFGNDRYLQRINAVSNSVLKLKANDLHSMFGVTSFEKSVRDNYLVSVSVEGCFSVSTEQNELIIFKRYHIDNGQIQTHRFRHTVLLHSNGHLKKLVEYTINNICYLYSPPTRLSFIIDRDTLAMHRCPFDRYGKWKNEIVVCEFQDNVRPKGILSAALTASNEQVILLDVNAHIFSIRLSQTADQVAIMRPVYLTDETENLKNFQTYTAVQTIGDPAIFFFQSQESVDVFDQNYCLLLRLPLDQSSTTPTDFRLHIFTDFVDTYCLALHLSDTPNIAYHLQNLVASSCIRQQENKNENDLDKASKSIGNWLLDTVKRGELKFGFNASRKKTQYHMVTPSTDYNKIILNTLPICNFLLNFIRIQREFSRILLSRVPIQICTIEGGNLIPLCNGKRRTLDSIVEKRTFHIETKTKDILFSYLDSILNGLTGDIRLIGVIGRQSTGKSYMMNRIFGTRFAVAAGRCTDGIWMNYAFVNNVHFLVFDCEGLFSNERTEDEEIKLIGFLAAVCDVTMLNQDLSFDRYQDRLFVLLSQTIAKVAKSEDFFKGNLLVAIRDIADSEASDAHAAAYKKFVDIKNKGQDQFLTQFTSKRANRWPNGATLALRLKILLVQLYTNDFCDSRRIHLNILLAELEAEARTLWCQYTLPNRPSEHTITVQFNNQPYSADIDQRKLILNDEGWLDNYERLCQMLSACLGIDADKNDITYKDTAIQLWSVANEMIPLVLDYRRVQVSEVMMARFREKISAADAEHCEAHCANFAKYINDYTAQFSVRICLQKCSSCDLLCTKIQRHTDELKCKLSQKKDELKLIEKEFGHDNSPHTNDIFSMEEKLTDTWKERQKLWEGLTTAETIKRYVDKRTEIEATFASKEGDLKKIQDDKAQNEQALSNIKQQLDTNVTFEQDTLHSSDYTASVFSQIEALLSPVLYNADELMTTLPIFVALAAELGCSSDETSSKEEILQFPVISNMEDSRVLVEDAMKANLENIEKCIEMETQIKTTFDDKSSSAALQSDDLSNRINGARDRLTELTNAADQYASRKENLIQDQAIQQAELDILQAEEQKLNLERIGVEGNQTATLADRLLVYINSLRKKEQEDVLVNTHKLQADHSFDSDIIILKSNVEAEDEPFLDTPQGNQTASNTGFVYVSSLQSLIDWHARLKKLEESAAITQQYLTGYQQRCEQISSEITQLQTRISNEQDLISKDILNEDLQSRQTDIATCEAKVAKFRAELCQKEEEIRTVCDQNPSLHDILNRQIPEFRHDALQSIEIRQNQVKQSIEEVSELISQLSRKLADEDTQSKHLNTEIESNEAEINLLTAQQQDLTGLLDQYKQFSDISTRFHQALTFTKDKLSANTVHLIKLYCDNDEQQLLFAKTETILENLRDLAERERCVIADLKVLEVQISILRQQPLGERVSHGAEYYREEYSRIKQEFNQIEQEIRTLESHLQAIDERSHLGKEIVELEKQVRSDCDCNTDHRCAHTCEICNESFPCMYRAGHEKKHKCNNGHVCAATCQVYNCMNQCHFSYEHEGTHQCERVHQCPAMCVCFKLCTIPLEVDRAHAEHRCGSTQCWKTCVLCERTCCTPDHNHHTTASKVTVVRNGTESTVDAHICDQPHTCLTTCEIPGVCGFEYKTSRAQWITSTGCVFDYEKIDVIETRHPCAVKIRPGFFQHSQDAKRHRCEVSTHTCTQRCPDCEALCRYPYGHSGPHSTLHRNQQGRIFTSTDAQGQIVIADKTVLPSLVRTYRVGEASTPESCGVACKRRGRAHFHLVECAGGDLCLEQQFGESKARHSQKIYYMDENQPSTSEYDEVLCAAYWHNYQWELPVSENDRALNGLCNYYCGEHVDLTKQPESSKGFCTLNAWHEGDHLFQCQDDHLARDEYEGVDVCFVIDTTTSMRPFFDQVKSTIIRIMEENQEHLKKVGKPSSEFKFGIVAYRDHVTKRLEYVVKTFPFSTAAAAITVVQNLTVGWGDDYPEAVLDGLDAANTLEWRAKADHLLFHVLDAPPHGRQFHNLKDN